MLEIFIRKVHFKDLVKLRASEQFLYLTFLDLDLLLEAFWIWICNVHLDDTKSICSLNVSCCKLSNFLKGLRELFFRK